MAHRRRANIERLIIMQSPDGKFYVCLQCGIPFIDGVGFLEPHGTIKMGSDDMMCINERYGWAHVREVDKDGDPINYRPC